MRAARRGGDRRLGVVGDAEAGLAGSWRDRWRRRRPPAFRCRRGRSDSRSSTSVAQLGLAARGSAPSTSPVELGRPAPARYWRGSRRSRSARRRASVNSVKPPETRQVQAPWARMVTTSSRPPGVSVMRLAQHFVDHADRQALQQRDALAQRRLERDLAAHGALGDRRRHAPSGRRNRPVRRCIPGRSWWNPCRPEKASCAGRPAAARRCRSADRRAPRAGGRSMARMVGGASG